MQTEDVRLAIYHHFATTGCAPTRRDVAERTGLDIEQVAAAYAELAAARHIALDSAGDITMAHPFTAVPLGFSVMGRATLWWGGCAWDSFALPHLLPDEPEVLVATTCRGCGRALSWVVTRDAPPPGDQVAHFLVPAVRIWDDVVHTCRNQRLFCDEQCVSSWLESSGNERGYVMDLPQLWRLAAHWYDGRLDRDYVRRDPSSATDYLYGVGLRGPFWRLPDS